MNSFLIKLTYILTMQWFYSCFFSILCMSFFQYTLVGSTKGRKCTGQVHLYMSTSTLYASSKMKIKFRKMEIKGKNM